MAKSKVLWTNGVYMLTKVGYDTNGNWSYWMKHYALIPKGSKREVRALKIQHMAMYNTACVKLTEELLLAGKPADQINKTMQIIIDTYRAERGLGRN